MKIIFTLQAVLDQKEREKENALKELREIETTCCKCRVYYRNLLNEKEKLSNLLMERGYNLFALLSGGVLKVSEAERVVVFIRNIKVRIKEKKDELDKKYQEMTKLEKEMQKKEEMYKRACLEQRKFEWLKEERMRMVRLKLKKRRERAMNEKAIQLYLINKNRNSTKFSIK